MSMKNGIVICMILLVSCIWQLQICFSGKSAKKKALPGLILLGSILALILFAVVGVWLYELGWPIYSAPYAAGIFAILLAFPLAGIGLAWVVYGIVKLVQNKRK